MPNSFRYLLVLMLPVLCAACATLDEKECLSADWSSVGFEDGQKGYLPGDRLERHGSACSKHGVVPEEEPYLIGHSDGLLDYCTGQQGLRLGRTGKEYNGVCVSFDFKQTDLKNALKISENVSGKKLDAVPDSLLKGKTVDIYVIDVPWDQALDQILLQHGMFGEVRDDKIFVKR